MTVSSIQTFTRTRKQAYRYWVTKTHRKRTRRANDDVTSTLECQWQNRAGENKHIAFFCGVAEWGNHISDALLDVSCDELRPLRASNERRLFRYYSRIMLAVAEILNDFEDALVNAVSKPSTQDFPKDLKNLIRPKNAVKVQVDKSVGKNIRTLLGSDVGDFHDFVNRVIKHKANNLHLADHHLPIRFDDWHPRTEAIEISIRNLKFSEEKNDVTAIRIPKLIWILDVLFEAYQKFNALLASDSLYDAVSKLYERSDLVLTDSESK